MQAALRIIGAQQLTAVVLAAIAPFRTSSGSVRLEHRFRYITGVPVEDRRPRRPQGVA
jgi:hypothetical protein